MALINYQTKLFPLVTEEIAGVPMPLLNQKMTEVVQEFCIYTQLWQEAIRPIDIKKDRDTYSLQANATDRKISRIDNVVLDVRDEQIHDGGDGTWWTGTADQGTWDFASTTESYNGGQSIDGIATVDTDYCTLARGYDMDITDFSDLTMAIKLTGWASGTDELALRWYLDGSAVGTSVNLSSYIDIENTTSWQTFVIPKADMGSPTSVDAIRITVSNTPNFYIDSTYLVKTAKTTNKTSLAGFDYSIDNFNTLVFKSRPTKDEANKLNAMAVYYPSDTGTNLPEWIWDHYRIAIASGVKAKLFRMKTSTWYDPDMAQLYAIEYSNRSGKAKADNYRGRSNSNMMVDLRFGRTV